MSAYNIYRDADMPVYQLLSPVEQERWAKVDRYLDVEDVSRDEELNEMEERMHNAVRETEDLKDKVEELGDELFEAKEALERTEPHSLAERVDDLEFEIQRLNNELAEKDKEIDYWKGRVRDGSR